VFQPQNFSFEINLTGLDGKAIHHLDEPITMTFTFTPEPGTNMAVAKLLTFDANGHTEVVHADYADNGDGTWTVTASLTHLSPFGLYASLAGTVVPANSIPILFNGVTSAGW